MLHPTKYKASRQHQTHFATTTQAPHPLIIFRVVLAVNVRQPDKVARALAVVAPFRPKRRVVSASPILLRSLPPIIASQHQQDPVSTAPATALLLVRPHLVASTRGQCLHFFLSELGHGNRLDAVRKLAAGNKERERDTHTHTIAST